MELLIGPGWGRDRVRGAAVLCPGVWAPSGWVCYCDGYRYVGLSEVPFSTADCCFPLLMGPRHCREVVGVAVLSFSMAVGACELPVGRG